MKKHIPYTLLFLLLACVEDFKHDAVDTTIVDPTIAGKTQITFQQLFDLHSKQIGKDTIVVGYISSSDAEGNFYKEVFVQNTLGSTDIDTHNPRMGMRIRVGSNTTSTQYAKGRKVIINLEGLKKTTSNGLLTLGKPSQTYIKDILAFDVDKHILKTTEVGELIPKTISIADLATQDVNTLLKIKDLHFKAQEVGKALAGLPSDDFDGQRTLVFCKTFRQDTILLETSNFADFASETIPNQQVAIEAIYTINFNDEPVLVLSKFDDLTIKGAYKTCNTTIPNVLITEIADPKNASFARYVELYNNENQEVDLNGWVLNRYVNGDSEQVVALDGLTIKPKSFVIIANQENSTDTNKNFKDSFLMQPDKLSSKIDGNGDDAYVLKNQSNTIIDVYGNFDEDGTGKNWEYTDGRAYRNIDVVQPNSTFDLSEWTILKDDQIAPQDFSPKQRKPNESKIIIETANLLITEVADPKDNAKARFVEIYNPTTRVVSLKNWTLARYNFTVSKNTKPLAKLTISLDAHTIPANGFLIIARDATEFNAYFGVDTHLSSSKLDGNGDDAYELIDPFENIVDIYGNSHIDGTSTVWEYTDGNAIRKPSITTASPIFNPTEWTFHKNNTTGVDEFSPLIR